MQPEAKLGKKIREHLEHAGAFVFKIHGGPQMMAGLPDLIVCHGGRFIGVEVKMPGANPTPRQQFVHSLIKRAGGEVIVARSVEDIFVIAPSTM
jgi:hypothetical protein